MAAWISIYCAQAVEHLTPADLREALDLPDYWTLAEWYGLPEALVAPARAHLRIEPAGEGDGFDVYALHYREPGQRPVTIHRWAAPERVREEVAEARARLEGRSGYPVERVRALLARTKEVVGIELGWSQTEGDMGVVFAYEVARCVAKAGRGYIFGLDEGWSIVDSKGGFLDVLPPGKSS